MARNQDSASAQESGKAGPGVAYRRSIRLVDHDYSSGAYFVTMRAAEKSHPLGRIRQGRTVENRFGGIVRRCWEGLPGHYPNVALDAFVVMPDHVHGIVVFRNTDRVGVFRDRGARAGSEPAPTGRDAPADVGAVRHGLPEVARGLKTFSARRINAMRGTPGTPVWQRGYYERLIRDEHALKNLRRYIESNPSKAQRTRETPNP